MQANHMVGIVWQNLAQYQTWFGPAAYLVHAIQVRRNATRRDATERDATRRNATRKRELPACLPARWAALARSACLPASLCNRARSLALALEHARRASLPFALACWLRTPRSHALASPRALRAPCSLPLHPSIRLSPCIRPSPSVPSVRLSPPPPSPQIIPVLPVSEALLPAAFVAQEYPVLAKSCASTERCITDGWAPFATAARAIVDAEGAWREALDAPAGSFSRDSPAGNGNSRLNLLHWIATRPELADGGRAHDDADAEDDADDDALARLRAARAAGRDGGAPALLGAAAMLVAAVAVGAAVAAARRGGRSARGAVETLLGGSGVDESELNGAYVHAAASPRAAQAAC
jgi:hypothetical protein